MNYYQYAGEVFAVSFVLLLLSCLMYFKVKNILKETRWLIEDQLVSLKCNNKKHKLASKEKEQELDQALGLQTIKTKITNELYGSTVSYVMENHDIVEQAAIRLIIQYYKDNQWICVEYMHQPLYPNLDELVFAFCSSTNDYLCAAWTISEGINKWVIVDHLDNYIDMPDNLIITHWKQLDGVISI